MKVIVVDDDDFAAQVLAGLMRNMGFEVVRGRNGLDAMRVLVDDPQSISLVLTDVFMPEMSGLELFRTIRTHESLKDLPVILVSGLADINLVTEAAKAGCSHFLVKPVKKDKVREKVQELVPLHHVWLKDPSELLVEHQIQITFLHNLADRFHKTTLRLLGQLQTSPKSFNGKNDLRPLLESAELLGTDELKVMLQGYAQASSVSPAMMQGLEDLRNEIQALCDKVVHRSREESALAILTAAEKKRQSKNENEVESDTITVAGRTLRRDTGKTPRVIVYGPRTLSHELMEAAIQGQVRAQFDVGLAFLRGYGCDINNEKAIEWLTKSAQQGSLEAQTHLGLIFLERDAATNDESWNKATELFSAAAQNGHREARYWKETMSGSREKIAFLQAAKSGDPAAQYKLGLFYDLGIEFDQNVNEAMFWLGQSAKQGYLDAQYRLGLIHMEERSGSSSSREAIRLFREAADLDHPEAQYALGRMYNLALGVTIDVNLAMRWYEKAARQGHAKAQFELANLHESAPGLNSNPKEALRWYLVSAATGFSAAAKRIADMQASLDIESIHQAETLARSTLESIGNSPAARVAENKP
jgi:TPR repeat protein/CheY-like chemotaxis protein